MSALDIINDSSNFVSALSSSCRSGCFDLATENLNCISELGRGNGGIIFKVQHKLTGILLVRKVYQLDLTTKIRAQIMRDLQILSECSSPYLVEFYGASHLDNAINIYREYMDAGGLDSLLPIVGRFPEPIIVYISDAIVQGLYYLRTQWNIVHRNLKPSNVLVTRSGLVKLSDFIVSQQLNDYLSSAYIGLCTYIAPERLSGEFFGSPSDVWSLGVTLMEMAVGQYPIPVIDPVDFVRAFAPDRESNMIEHWKAIQTGESLTGLTNANSNTLNSLFELFAYVIEQPAPRLPAYCFSSEFLSHIHMCLQKDPVDRPSIDLLHDCILPNLMKQMEIQLQCHYSDCTHLDEDSAQHRLSSESLASSVFNHLFREYLRAIFAREQNEALDAVALAVEENLDSLNSDVVDSNRSALLEQKTIV